MSLVAQRWESLSITNAIFAGTLLIPLLLPFLNPLFQLPEFAPPQVIYSKDLVPLLLAPWTSPSNTYRAFSRPLQSVLFFRLPQDSVLPCYSIWVAIGLSRTLVGFLLSRSVGWAYPNLFNHWALYESIGGCGPPLVTYLIASGSRPDLAALLARFRGARWEATESLVLLVVCMLLVGLDDAPWTYGIAIGLALLALICRAVFAAFYSSDATSSHPDPDFPRGFPQKHPRGGFQMALLLFVFVSLPSIICVFLTNPPTSQMSSMDNMASLDIVLLSYPRPNDTLSSPDHNSILSQTIASYLPYVSMNPSTTLSVFTHAKPFTHPSFLDAQQQFQDAPVTFYTDHDTHPDAHEGQYLHLMEAFRWLVEKGTMGAEWVMLVEDDFPLCGDWGWQGILRVMQELEQGHNSPSPQTTKIWGGFVGTGGSGLILHRSLLPILVHTLRLHSLTSSPFLVSTARRPADIIIQDCLLGADPLCPTAPSSKDTAEGTWITRKQPTMVITSRLVMDHIGGRASTTKGRVYNSNMWRCGWRHPFHGRPEVIVVPI